MIQKKHQDWHPRDSRCFKAKERLRIQYTTLHTHTNSQRSIPVNLAQGTNSRMRRPMRQGGAGGRGFASPRTNHQRLGRVLLHALVRTTYARTRIRYREEGTKTHDTQQRTNRRGGSRWVTERRELVFWQIQKQENPARLYKGPEPKTFLGQKWKTLQKMLETDERLLWKKCKNFRSWNSLKFLKFLEFFWIFWIFLKFPEIFEFFWNFVKILTFFEKKNN